MVMTRYVVCPNSQCDNDELHEYEYEFFNGAIGRNNHCTACGQKMITAGHTAEDTGLRSPKGRGFLTRLLFGDR